MDKKYRVVFLSLNGTRTDFGRGMSRLGISQAIVEQMIDKAPVILKQDMNPGQARRYADAILYAGGRVNIQEHSFFEEADGGVQTLKIKPMDNFTMCPECGQKQTRTGACVKCGFILEAKDQNQGRKTGIQLVK